MLVSFLVLYSKVEEAQIKSSHNSTLPRVLQIPET